MNRAGAGVVSPLHHPGIPFALPRWLGGECDMFRVRMRAVLMTIPTDVLKPDRQGDSVISRRVIKVHPVQKREQAQSAPDQGGP